MAKEKCDRDCSTCGSDNRSFCAVQMAMANQEILMAILKEVHEMKSGDKELIPPSLVPEKIKSEPTGSGAETIKH